MGPLTNGRTSCLIIRGDPNHLRVLGAHPPSMGSVAIIPPQVIRERNEPLETYWGVHSLAHLRLALFP